MNRAHAPERWEDYHSDPELLKTTVGYDGGHLLGD